VRYRPYYKDMMRLQPQKASFAITFYGSVAQKALYGMSGAIGLGCLFLLLPMISTVVCSSLHRQAQGLSPLTRIEPVPPSVRGTIGRLSSGEPEEVSKPVSSPAVKNSEKAAAPDVVPPLDKKARESLFKEIILEASARHQVDPALVKAVIMAESRYNPKALSKRGAMGLMQLMPATARSLGVVDGFDPHQNINGGVRYLKGLLRRFDGDVGLALAAYNAGISKVLAYEGIPPFTTTRRYVQDVLSYYRFYKREMTG